MFFVACNSSQNVASSPLPRLRVLQPTLSPVNSRPVLAFTHKILFSALFSFGFLAADILQASVSLFPLRLHFVAVKNTESGCKRESWQQVQQRNWLFYGVFWVCCRQVVRGRAGGWLAVLHLVELSVLIASLLLHSVDF